MIIIQIKEKIFVEIRTGYRVRMWENDENGESDKRKE